MFFALKVVVWIELAMVAGWFLFQKTAARDLSKYFGRRYLMLLASIPVIAFLLPRVELVYLAALLIVPMFAKTRSEAVIVYIVSLFVFPELQSPLEIGSFYLITMTVPMALTLGLTVSFFLRPGDVTKVDPSIIGVILVFSALLLVSGLRDGALPMRPVVDILVRTVLPFYLIARMLRSGEDIRLALTAIVLVAICLGILAVLESARNWPIYQEVYKLHDIGLPVSSARMIRGGVMRAPASFVESTSFAILLMMSLFIVAIMPALAKSPGKRIMLMGTLLLAMLAAVSRGAFLGAAIGLFAATIYAGKWQRAAILAIGSAGIFLTLRAAAPYSAFLSGIFNTQSFSGQADYRVDLFNAGIEIVKQYPLMGLSFNQLNERLSFLSAGGLVDFVNTYLFFAMTMGLPGLLGFSALTLTPLILLVIRRRRAIRFQNEAVALVAMASSAAFLFFFTSFWERNPYWLILVAAFASVVLNARKNVKRSSSEAPKSSRSNSLPRLASIQAG